MLESQEQPFSADLKTKQNQSLTNWGAKDNHFSRLENKASLITHCLEKQRQSLAGLQTKQAQSLTDWRAKDNHF